MTQGIIPRALRYNLPLGISWTVIKSGKGGKERKMLLQVLLYL